ncbi:kinase [Pelagibacterales bacterium SAG-MED08]|nr:kinase [Pelagibacterales bacterium SAG-MED08]
MIITRSPFRISLFGGGTDYPSWLDGNKGAVISMAINKYCYISIRNLPPYFDYKYRIRYYQHEQVKNINQIKHPTIRETLNHINYNGAGLEINHNADIPALSGLGSSSTFTVGLFQGIKKLMNIKTTKYENASNAIYIEQNKVGDHVGLQDQVIASYGGLNFIKFYKNKKFRVSRINLSNNIKNKINNNFFLVFTGLQRLANSITRNQVKKTISGKNDIYLNKILDITHQIKSEIYSKNNFDLNDISKALDEQWYLKKKLENKISNPQIDEIYNFAKKNGSIGGKLLGAGGGGFFLFIVPDNNIRKFKKAIKKFIHVPFSVDNFGSKIIYENKNN